MILTFILIGATIWVQPIGKGGAIQLDKYILYILLDMLQNVV